MKREYCLHIIVKDDVQDYYKACEIVFESGKGCCGFKFKQGLNLEFNICGRFCDMVRVYSALKNNGYAPRIERLEDDA